MSKSLAHGRKVHVMDNDALVSHFVGESKASASSGKKRTASKRKAVTVASLSKAINKLGKRKKDDDAIDKWVSAKRRKDVPMSVEHREYFVSTREAIRSKVVCTSGDAEHKCSIVALEKARKTHTEYKCPSCAEDVKATLVMRLRYPDSNEYLEEVPYLDRSALDVAITATPYDRSGWATYEPTLFWNSRKHGC
jgi:hypothetical protein